MIKTCTWEVVGYLKFQEQPRNQDNILPPYLIFSIEESAGMTIYFLDDPQSIEPGCREENTKC